MKSGDFKNMIDSIHSADTIFTPITDNTYSKVLYFKCSPNPACYHRQLKSDDSWEEITLADYTPLFAKKT